MSLASTPLILERSYTLEVSDWLQSIPLSRPLRNISRDFSDCVLVAELVRHFKPTYVTLHNFPSASSFKQKVLNWETLNMKVMRKLGMRLTRSDIDNYANAVPGAIERILLKLKRRLLDASSSSGCPPSAQTRSKSIPDHQEETPVTPQFSSEPPDMQLIHDLQEQVRILTERNLKLLQLVQIKEKKIKVLLKQFNDSSQ